MTGQRCGTVALMGLPNAGKSTLLNALVGKDVSVVTHKAHTTQDHVVGLMCQQGTQCVLIDTPGASHSLHKKENIILFVVDAAAQSVYHLESALKDLNKRQAHCYLVLNKIDRVTDKTLLLQHAAHLNALCPFRETFMISASRKSGLQELATTLTSLMPEGEWLFSGNDTTSRSPQALAEDITRKMLLMHTHQEVPYTTYIRTDSWAERNNGLHIRQTLFVRKKTHKAIVIGKAGSRLCALGREARLDMQALFGQPCHLFLQVKMDRGTQKEKRRT